MLYEVITDSVNGLFSVSLNILILNSSGAVRRLKGSTPKYERKCGIIPLDLTKSIINPHITTDEIKWVV